MYGTLMNGLLTVAFLEITMVKKYLTVRYEKKNTFQFTKEIPAQGFCCVCDFQHRGGSQMCSGFADKLSRNSLEKLLLNKKNKLWVGHCLVHDGLK